MAGQMINKTKTDLLNDLLKGAIYSKVYEMAELAIDSGASLHKSQGDDLVIEAMRNGNTELLALLIGRGAVISPQVVHMATGLCRCGDIEVEHVVDIIKHVDWDLADDTVPITSLILSVLINPIAPIKAEVERFFDFKEYIVSKELWVGGVLECIRSPEEHNNIVDLLNALPVERFTLQHDNVRERKIKKQLVKTGQYELLCYLNDRGALNTGLSFDDNYYSEAAHLSDMLDAGYDIQCRWDIRVFFKKDIQAATLFNPRLERAANLRAQLRFMVPLHDAEQKDNCLQKMAVLIRTHASLYAKMEESPKVMTDFYEELIDKGYFDGLQLVLSDINQFKDRKALLIRLFHSSERCWQYLLSGKVKIHEDARSIFELCRDVEMAKAWLSRYAPESRIFRDLEEMLLVGSVTPISLLSVVAWNIERRNNFTMVKFAKFEELLMLDRFRAGGFWEAVSKCSTVARTDGERVFMDGALAFMLYLSDESELIRNVSHLSSQNLWQSICQIRQESPLYYFDKLPNGSPARPILVSLLSEVVSW